MVKECVVYPREQRGNKIEVDGKGRNSFTTNNQVVTRLLYVPCLRAHHQITMFFPPSSLLLDYIKFELCNASTPKTAYQDIRPRHMQQHY